jgi:hypothetical protein
MVNSQVQALMQRLAMLDKSALELLLFANKCLVAVNKGKPVQAVQAYFKRDFDFNKLKTIQSDYKILANLIKEQASGNDMTFSESILLREATLRLGRRTSKIGMQVARLYK